MEFNDMMVNISLLKTVGEISEKKVASIINQGYELIHYENGHFAHFNDKDSKNTFVVATNQITIVGEDGSEQLFSDTTPLINIYSNIFDILMLDGKGIIEMTIERLYKGSENTFDNSFRALNEEHMHKVKEIGGTAVALRIPVRNEHLNGEIKLEPFFQEKTRFFISCHLRTNEERSISDVSEVLGQFLDYINSKVEPYAKIIFNQE